MDWRSKEIPKTLAGVYLLMVSLNNYVYKILNLIKDCKCPDIRRAAEALDKNTKKLIGEITPALQAQKRLGELELFDKYQFANILNVGIHSLYKYMKMPGFPAGYLIGGKHQWFLKEIEDWIKKHEFDDETRERLARKFE